MHVDFQDGRYIYSNLPSIRYIHDEPSNDTANNMNQSRKDFKFKIMDIQITKIDQTLGKTGSRVGSAKTSPQMQKFKPNVILRIEVLPLQVH